MADLFKQGNIYQPGQRQIVFKLARRLLPVSFVFGVCLVSFCLFIIPP